MATVNNHFCHKCRIQVELDAERCNKCGDGGIYKWCQKCLRETDIDETHCEDCQACYGKFNYFHCSKCQKCVSYAYLYTLLRDRRIECEVCNHTLQQQQLPSGRFILDELRKLDAAYTIHKCDHENVYCRCTNIKCRHDNISCKCDN